MERDPLVAGYPTIPQLWRSTGTRGDRFTGRAESLAAIRRCSVVVEKLDGWNIGFAPDLDRPLLKGTPVDWDQVPGDHEVVARLRDLVARASWNVSIFGEWCPDLGGGVPWFPFDVFDPHIGGFLRWNEVVEVAARCALTTPRVLHRGPLGVYSELVALACGMSSSGRPMEGVVLRVETTDRMVERFKFVRPGFVKRPM